MIVSGNWFSSGHAIDQSVYILCRKKVGKSSLCGRWSRCRSRRGEGTSIDLARSKPEGLVYGDLCHGLLSLNGEKVCRFILSRKMGILTLPLFVTD